MKYLEKILTNLSKRIAINENNNDYRSNCRDGGIMCRQYVGNLTPDYTTQLKTGFYNFLKNHAISEKYLTKGRDLSDIESQKKIFLK